ncbi:MAG: amidohydrolase, partial [Shimia sp.]
MPIKNRFAEMHDDLTAIRRDLHRHPEILFETHRTSALVADALTEYGCDEVVTGIGRTGVVGIIRGKTSASGRTIGLRADMDALPIHEATGAEHASQTPGAMHACGHDGHTTMLLGAARYLAETRNFDGTVAVIFQPAEEGGGGGKEMCDDGMMERFGIDEVYGMHNWPGMPVGAFGIRPGAFFAAADQFEITVTGKGGHAAKPQETVDTTVVASHIVIALQSVVSRNVDPVKQAVLSVTAFQTESMAHNVIPQTVLMRGTVRTLDADIRDLMERRL